MPKPTAKEVVDKLSDYVNYYNSDDGKDFAEAFKREHRTLQQSMFRVFLAVIEDMASNAYPTDGRNVGSHDVAKALINGFKKEKLEECLSQGMNRAEAEKYVEQFVNPSQYLRYV